LLLKHHQRRKPQKAQPKYDWSNISLPISKDDLFFTYFSDSAITSMTSAPERGACSVSNGAYFLQKGILRIVCKDILTEAIFIPFLAHVLSGNFYLAVSLQVLTKAYAVLLSLPPRKPEHLFGVLV